MRYLLLAPFDDPAIFHAVTGLDPASLRRSGAGAGAALPQGAAAARLDFYAAVHGAVPAPWAAPDERPDGEARVLALPALRLGGVQFDRPPTGRWLEIWREAANEIRDAAGAEEPAAVRARLGMIWSRAESRLRARAVHRAPPGGLDARNLRITRRDRPYAGFFALEDYTYSHDRFDGSDSGLLDRVCFIGADAVTVLPYDPGRDAVLVVEQIRQGAIGRGDPSPWLLEPVAGRIEPGDTPEQTAHKEAREEAGLALARLHAISGYYPTPGAFSEYLFSFIGIAELPDSAAGLGGLASEAEDIRAHVLPRTGLMEMIAQGRAPVGTLQLSALWLTLNLELVRRAG